LNCVNASSAQGWSCEVRIQTVRIEKSC
jgi:hypothetical protein